MTAAGDQRSNPDSAFSAKARRLRLFSAFLALLFLAACQTTIREETEESIQPSEPPLEAVEPEGPPVGLTADGKIGIGFLAPLSGPQAPVGQALLQAAQMAFLDNGGQELALLVEDSGGTAQGAAAAAQRLLDQGAGIVVGPLFSASTKAAAPVLAAAGVPLLSFSNDRSAAGQGAYVLGLDPASQVARVVDYASRQGLLRFAAFAPDTPYGRLAVAALQEAASRAPLSLQRVNFYDPAASTVNDAAKAFSDVGPENIDAVLIPDGGQRLLGVAPYLPYYDIALPEVRFLGTALWDDPEVAREEALAGSWFAAPEPAGWADFSTRYQDLFGKRPPRIASLGYDATAVATVLARGQTAASFQQPLVFSQEALTQAEGFFGADGIFRLNPDGSVERGLAIIEVKPSGFEVIEAAPQSFQIASF